MVHAAAGIGPAAGGRDYVHGGPPLVLDTYVHSKYNTHLVALTEALGAAHTSL